MVIVETQDIESPEIGNHSGFSIQNIFPHKKESTMGLPFLVFKTLSLI